MVGKNLAPVIIKRKKVIVSGGHHGGAWKVAYADFDESVRHMLWSCAVIQMIRYGRDIGYSGLIGS